MVRLIWIGATFASIDVYRDDVLIVATANDRFCSRGL
jgi:hypothetical protein